MTSSLPWDKPRRGVSAWKIATYILIGCVILCAVVGYVVHRRLVEKADSFDLSALSQMESASTIFDRRGNVLGHIYLQNREPVPLEKMSIYLQHAAIAAEDTRFYSHNGSDYKGILRAALKNARSNRIRQGASTITQQLARNTFPLKERTFSRKILEIYVAHRIETSLTKDQILEYYLNRIYLGSGLYGVEAASRGYFGKGAKDLTLGESATLAGLIKSPNNLSPWKNPKAAEIQRNYVLGHMVEHHLVSREEAEAAVALPLKVKSRSFVSSDSYAIEAIRQQVVSLIGFDAAVGMGYKIYTTIDGDLQREAEENLSKQLEFVETQPAFEAMHHQTYATYKALYQEEEKKAQHLASLNPKAPPPNPHAWIAEPAYLQGAILAIDNSDGGIVTLVGGRNFKHSEYNRALSPNAKRPFGTAFTPLVYAAAYQKGIFPGTLFLDQVIDNRQVMIGGETGILGEWGVEKAENQYEGAIPATIALSKGKNAATVRVGNETGLNALLALTKRAGITSQMREFPSTFLGSSELTISELVLAYTGFPNGGWRPAAPYLISKITDADGRVVMQNRSGPRVRIVDEDPAFQTHNALMLSLKEGSGEAATKRYGLKPETHAAGKTGTAYNFTDVLFCGYNPRFTCAVWMGYDAPRTPIYRGAFSNELTLPVWVKWMNAAAAIYPVKPIPKPADLKEVELCSISGDLATDQCEQTVNGEKTRCVYTEYATETQLPQRKCLVHNGLENPDAMAAITSTNANSNLGRMNVVSGGRQREESSAPKATSAVDLSQFHPVGVKASTVVENESKDPYGVPKEVPIPVAKAVTEEPAVPPKAEPVPKQEVVKKAIPVTPETESVAPSQEEATEVRRAQLVPMEKPSSIDFDED